MKNIVKLIIISLLLIQTASADVPYALLHHESHAGIGSMFSDEDVFFKIVDMQDKDKILAELNDFLLIIDRGSFEEYSEYRVNFINVDKKGKVNYAIYKKQYPKPSFFVSKTKNNIDLEDLSGNIFECDISCFGGSSEINDLDISIYSYDLRLKEEFDYNFNSVPKSKKFVDKKTLKFVPYHLSNNKNYSAYIKYDYYDCENNHYEEDFPIVFNSIFEEKDPLPEKKDIVSETEIIKNETVEPPVKKIEDKPVIEKNNTKYLSFIIMFVFFSFGMLFAAWWLYENYIENL